MARSRIRKYAFHRAGVAARAVGSLSAGRRREPDFLVVGAQRAGTTSLFKALLQHPSYVPPRFRKGVHYFDMDYDKGWRWYLGHFPNRSTVDKVAAATGGAAVTGEASPYYMWHPLVPDRIAKDLPGRQADRAAARPGRARLLRATPHEFARGFETETFEVAIDLEDGRLAGEREKMIADATYHSHAVRHLAHLHRGIYIEQLERLEKLFGRDRILVVDSHDYFAHPKTIFTEVCAFLGLPDAPEVVHDAHNARPRSAMSPEMEARLRELLRAVRRAARGLARIHAELAAMTVEEAVGSGDRLGAGRAARTRHPDVRRQRQADRQGERAEPGRRGRVDRGRSRADRRDHAQRQPGRGRSLLRARLGLPDPGRGSPGSAPRPARSTGSPSSRRRASSRGCGPRYGSR